MDSLVRGIEGLLKGSGRAVVCNGEDVAIRLGCRIRREITVRSRRTVEHNGRWLLRCLDNSLKRPVDAEIPGVVRGITRDAGNLRVLQFQRIGVGDLGDVAGDIECLERP